MDQFLTLKRANIGPAFNFTACVCMSLSFLSSFFFGKGKETTQETKRNPYRTLKNKDSSQGTKKNKACQKNQGQGAPVRLLSYKAYSNIIQL